MNILDCVGTQWQSVYDHAADGNEVEKVVITPLGDNKRINIIVGYSLINQSEKVVSIYHYENGASIQHLKIITIPCLTPQT